MELKQLILETCRAHADTARAAYTSRQPEVDRLRREIAVLKGEVDMLRQTLGAVRVENITLRAQVRALGGTPTTDGLVVR